MADIDPFSGGGGGGERVGEEVTDILTYST